MSKSLLYSVNTNPQTITIGDDRLVNLGTPVRRYGNNINTSDGNIVLAGCGYYDIDVSVVVVATGTGDATLTLYKDGVPIAGGTSTITVGTSGDTETIDVKAVVKENCPCESVITAILSGEITSVVVNLAKAIVEKS